jgi:RHS repeat-associated protein
MIYDCFLFWLECDALDICQHAHGVVTASRDRGTWSYDGIYQLVREQRSGTNSYDVSYSYDALGNRLMKLDGGVATTYSYDGANQLEYEETPSARTTFSYDANGNMTVTDAGGSLTTSTWDFENMCVAMALPSGARNTFAYDAALKRRSAEDSAALVRFVHDGENVLLETDGSAATQVSYTLEPAGYGNLISQRRGSDSSWHHFDALGSTDRLTDASESELASYVQTAFGEPKATTGSHPNRLRWIGRLGYRWEPDTGQYDVRRRRYDPQRGRWITRDPLADVAQNHQLNGTAVYRYAVDNPVNQRDPSGLVCTLDFTQGVLALHVEHDPGALRDPFVPGVWNLWWTARSGPTQDWEPQCRPADSAQHAMGGAIPAWDGWRLTGWEGPSLDVRWSRRGMLAPNSVRCTPAGGGTATTRGDFRIHRSHYVGRLVSNGCIVVGTDREIRKVECCTSAAARARDGGGWCRRFRGEDWGICSDCPPPGMACDAPIGLAVHYIPLAPPTVTPA